MQVQDSEDEDQPTDDQGGGGAPAPGAGAQEDHADARSADDAAAMDGASSPRLGSAAPAPPPDDSPGPLDVHPTESQLAGLRDIKTAAPGIYRSVKETFTALLANELVLFLTAADGANRFLSISTFHSALHLAVTLAPVPDCLPLMPKFFAGCSASWNEQILEIAVSDSPRRFVMLPTQPAHELQITDTLVLDTKQTAILAFQQHAPTVWPTLSKCLESFERNK